MLERPDIFEKSQFREALSLIVEFQREHGTYSNKKFAKRAGLGSSSHLRMILQGRRTPSRVNLERILNHLDLSRFESEYIISLFDLETASTEEDRQNALIKVVSLKRRAYSQRVKPSMLEVLDRWQDWAITEYICRADGIKKLEPLVEGLKISHSQAEESISRLLQVGILERNEDQIVSSASYIGGFENSLQLFFSAAAEIQSKLKQSPPPESFVYTAAIFMNESELEIFQMEIKKLIAEFRSKIDLDQSPQRLYLFNLAGLGLDLCISDKRTEPAVDS